MRKSESVRLKFLQKGAARSHAESGPAAVMQSGEHNSIHNEGRLLSSRPTRLSMELLGRRNAGLTDRGEEVSPKKVDRG